MATVVFLHAHPDDETTLTGGSMALAHRAGHRVVWVCCTDGSLGTQQGTDESLAAIRRREAAGSAQVLGVDRLVFLDYQDSGMTGWASNADPDAFMNADVELVGRRVADILDEEGADVLVGYDWHGNYGHPDHIMVHKVMRRAAELAARTPRVLQATMSRDALRAFYQQAPEGQMAFDPDGPADDGNPFGMPETEIAWRVDVSAVIEDKRRALEAHGSQEDAQGMLALPLDQYAVFFGYEYYMEEGRGRLQDGCPV